jgi:phosphotransferase system enzyme I (PtsP)
MIATPAEFADAKAIALLELERAKARGQPLPEPFRVGAMLEVPSLIWQLPALLREADFVSVGSNDLAQFMFASDRGNPRMAGRYDALSPAMLTALAQVCGHCRAAKRPLSVCGEMAGHPLEAMALLAIGINRLSMAPSAVGGVKSMLRSLDIGRLSSYIGGLMTLSRTSVRHELAAYARDHGVVL